MQIIPLITSVTFDLWDAWNILKQCVLYIMLWHAFALGQAHMVQDKFI